MFNNILVVCIGNICRSPMGEGLLKQALADKNKTAIQVSSAGLGALVGHAPDPNSCKLMLEKGVDISGYRARQLDKEMIRKSDLILVMETAHKIAIEENEPSAKGKVFRLGEWGKFDIADPYRKDLNVFVDSFKHIEQGVSDWIQKL